MQRDPITKGKDFNFFQKVNVSQTTFGGESHIIFNFRNQCCFSMVNEGSGVVEYSFNGEVLHGDMTPGTSTEAMLFDNRRVSKIWFRVVSGTHIVRVEAWAAI